MQRVAGWLAGRLIADADRVRDPLVRSRYGVLEGWVSAVVNLVLAAAKFVLGVMLHSAGLISDAVHTLGDMATSVVLIISFRIARKPPDQEHPFGHAKAEQVATLIVAVLLVVAGFEVGQETVAALLDPAAGAPMPLTWPVLAVLVVLLLAKEALAWFSNALGRLIDSAALAADGWHHRSDALATGLVIVGLAGRNWGITWLDPAAGVVVALFVMGMGFKLAWDSVSPLVGDTATEEELERMKAIAQHTPGVMDVHDVTVHRYGHFYFTTLHIEVSDRMDVHRMHEVAELMEMRLLRAFPGQCVVHVDPINVYHPLFHRVADTLRDLVVAHPHLVEFHDLHLWSAEGGERGDVEVAVAREVADTDYPALSQYLVQGVQTHHPELDFEVHLKVDFSATPLQAT